MKRSVLILILLLAATAGSATAGVTVVNQTAWQVTATITSATSQSSPVAANASWVPGAPPTPTWTVKFTRPSNPSILQTKEFYASTQTIYLRPVGQTINIVLSNDPPTTTATPSSSKK